MTGAILSVQVVRSAMYVGDAGWRHPVNLYPYNTLYFVTGGDGFVRVGETVTPLRAGHVYLIPANTLFGCWCNTGIEKFYLEAYVEALPGEDVFSGLTGIQERPYPVDDIMALAQRDTDRLRDTLWFQGALLNAFSLFADVDWQPPGAEQLRFKPILDDIARNLASDIRLSDIAMRHGWHPSALSRAFHRAFGCGLKQYVNRLLANKLKQELLTTDRRLRELAITYRFCDAYYLSAFFRRETGLSPEAYRRTNPRPVHAPGQGNALAVADGSQ